MPVNGINYRRKFTLGARDWHVIELSGTVNTVAGETMSDLMKQIYKKLRAIHVNLFVLERIDESLRETRSRVWNIRKSLESAMKDHDQAFAYFEQIKRDPRSVSSSKCYDIAQIDRNIAEYNKELAEANEEAKHLESIRTKALKIVKDNQIAEVDIVDTLNEEEKKLIRIQASMLEVIL